MSIDDPVPSSFSLTLSHFISSAKIGSISLDKGHRARSECHDRMKEKVFIDSRTSVRLKNDAISDQHREQPLLLWKSEL